MEGAGILGALLASNGEGKAFPFILAVGLCYSLVRGWVSWRRSVRLKDTPNVPPSVVPFGRAESTGVARPPEGLSQVGRTPSVWYAFKLEEYVRRNKSSSWETRAEGSSGTDFFLTDDHGFIGVRVDGAIIDVPFNASREAEQLTLSHLEAFSHTQAKLSRMTHDRNVRVDELPGEWRVLEQVIPIDATVTVAGPVLASSDPAVGEFRYDKTQGGRGGELYVALGDERSVESKNAFGLWRLIGSALCIGPSIMGGIALNASHPENLAWVPISVSVGLGTLMVFAAVIWRVILDQYNRTVVLANQVESCWSMLDVALVRRATLIPRLQAVVGAAFAHEKGVQAAVAAARWDSTRRESTDAARASAASNAALAPALMALAEAYPDVRTDENARALHAELVRTENLIQAARATYNRAVELFLTRLSVFPSSLFAGQFKDRRQSYWQA